MMMAEKTTTAKDSGLRRARRTVVGVVAKARKTPMTLRVEVQFLVQHARYGKFLRRSSVLHVHDPENQADVGDRVEVMECRPISKTKTWRLVKILDKAPQD